MQIGNLIALLLHHLRRRPLHEVRVRQLRLQALQVPLLFGELLFQTLDFCSDINQAARIDIKGQPYFVKYKLDTPPRVFEIEALGLKLLQNPIVRSFIASAVEGQFKKRFSR